MLLCCAAGCDGDRQCEDREEWGLCATEQGVPPQENFGRRIAKATCTVRGREGPTQRMRGSGPSARTTPQTHVGGGHVARAGPVAAVTGDATGPLPSCEQPSVGDQRGRAEGPYLPFRLARSPPHALPRARPPAPINGRAGPRGARGPRGQDSLCSAHGFCEPCQESAVYVLSARTSQTVFYPAVPRLPRPLPHAALLCRVPTRARVLRR